MPMPKGSKKDEVQAKGQAAPAVTEDKAPKRAAKGGAKAKPKGKKDSEGGAAKRR